MMNEGPDRPVVHFEAAASKLRHKGAQGEVSLRDALPKKGGMRAHHKPPPVAAHFPCRSAPRRPESLRPFYHARSADAQRPSNQTPTLARLNPRNRPLTQIHRIGSCHPPKPPTQIQPLNQKPGNLGIPTDSAKPHPALLFDYIQVYVVRYV